MTRRQLISGAATAFGATKRARAQGAGEISRAAESIHQEPVIQREPGAGVQSADQRQAVSTRLLRLPRPKIRRFRWISRRPCSVPKWAGPSPCSAASYWDGGSNLCPTRGSSKAWRVRCTGIRVCIQSRDSKAWSSKAAKPKWSLTTPVFPGATCGKPCFGMEGALLGNRWLSS